MLHRRTPSYLCSESWRYGAPYTNRTCHLPLRSRLGALFKINSLQQLVLFHQLLTITLGNSGLLTLTLCLRQIYAQNFYGGLGAERKFFPCVDLGCIRPRLSFGDECLLRKDRSPSTHTTYHLSSRTTQIGQQTCDTLSALNSLPGGRLKGNLKVYMRFHSCSALTSNEPQSVT